MTYRDDRDALLARADALEGELERSQEALETKQDRLEQTEAELARLRAENRRLRAQSESDQESPPPAPRPPLVEEPVVQPIPYDETTRRSPGFNLVATFVLFVILGGLAFSVYIVLTGPK